MRPPLIHIGYHRTGSTWLQTVVFASGPFVSPWKRGEIVREFVTPDPFRFMPNEVRASFESALTSGESASKVLVLSHEDLSGNPHAGGYNRKEIAERLSAVFPESRVLIVIREQKDLILSFWKQYVRLGGPSSLKNYLFAPWTAHPRIPRFDFRHLEYDSLVACYQGLFGDEKVLVLPFELLKQNAESFVSAIALFAETDSPGDLDTRPRYSALSGPTCAIKRRLNLFLARTSVNPSAPVYLPGLNGYLTKGFEVVDRLVPPGLRRRSDRRAASYLREAVGQRYVVSNRRTKEMTGLKLEELGYDLGAPSEVERPRSQAGHMPRESEQADRAVEGGIR